MAGATLRYEHFEILADEHGQPLRLGRGGMGATFRAYDTRLRRPVALKIINERSLANATIRRRFFNEARAAALIDHPNVARVLYLCPEDAEECFFTMELIEGESLADFVSRRGPLPGSEALALLRPVAEALSALAAQQLIHRDLKPENIMITPGGAVKLIDFGIAKPLGQGSERFDLVDSEGQFVGSVYFASPEQILATQPLDQCSDFYSLGATLWHAVTGAPPFTGSRYEVQEAHLRQTPDFGKVAHGPHALLARLLAKAPADRPADVPALLAEWDTARREMEELTATSIHEPSTEPVVVRDISDAPTVVDRPTALTFEIADDRAPTPDEAQQPQNSTAAETPQPAERATTKAPAPSRRPQWVIAALVVAIACAAGVYLLMKKRATSAVENAAPEAISPLLAATADAPFTNSLGMEFVPVPIAGGPLDTHVLFCRHETRRSDFEAFTAAVSGISDSWRAPIVSGVKMPTGAGAEAHPVINISWADAVAFCAWLTAQERREGRLRGNELYRLPTDHEWSCAAGIGDLEDAQRPPKEKSGGLADVFPWGRGFLPANPPPAPRQKLPGNYAGEESRGTWAGIIEGYADDFLTTAPVRSFPPNSLGLYDLGGNAWEWCQDEWAESSEARAHVLRGASCINSLPNLLNVSYRKAAAGDRVDLAGFRCVLSSQPP